MRLAIAPASVAYTLSRLTAYIALSVWGYCFIYCKGTPRPDNGIKQDTFLTPFLCPNKNVSMEDESSENSNVMKLKLGSNIEGVILLLIMFFMPMSIFAQWGECFSYKGDWSRWQEGRGMISHYNDESGILLKTDGGQTYFSFHINHYVAPTKKQLKEHLKTGQWFEYSGTVEYYVNDTYPTAEAIAKVNRFVIPNPRNDQTPTVKRSTTCVIRIAPYKSLPSNYNVFFDNIGVAISIKGLSFQGEKGIKNNGRVVANVIQSVLLFPIGLGSWLWNPVYEGR